MPTSKISTFVVYVNGNKVTDDHLDPEWTLLTYLRNKLKLCGTKLGCGEGGCGACTVMLSRFNRTTNTPQHYAVNACLMPIAACHGLSVTTVEGIGSVERGLHPAQERIAKSHGSQCGFCTPGIVMSMYTLMRNKPVPDMEDVEVAFQGNLCRCTGYRPILEGYKTLTTEGAVVNGAANGGGGCCKANGPPTEPSGGCCKKTAPAVTSGGCCQAKAAPATGCCKANGQNGDSCALQCATLFDPSEFKPFDPSLEPPFPSELASTPEYDDQSVLFIGERVKWYRPTTLRCLLELKAEYPFAKLVVGNTEIGVETKFKNMHYPVIIAPTRVVELTRISLEEKGIRFGASVTLSELEAVCEEQIRAQPAHRTRTLKAIIEMLRWFAGRQIRNTAAIGGNIITGSPISDLNPIFMAAGSELELVSTGQGTRTVAMDDKFFTGYRKTVLRSEEILQSILVPWTREDEYFWAFKQSKRRDDDIAIVNAGMRVQFQIGTNVIKSVALAYGGMAPTTVMARTTAATLVGQPWNEHIVDLACRVLAEDLPLDPGAPGGMIGFRRSLTLSFFYKFYLIVTSELAKKLPFVKELDALSISATKPYHRDSSELKATQLYQVVPADQPDHDLVGRPMAHVSGLKQATGEAVYIDDIPRYEDELYLALVLSTRAHATIVNIDASAALQTEGVVDFICGRDLPPERNIAGPIIHDEQVFAWPTVTCIGHVVGAVVGTTQTVAQRAARLVKIEYQDFSPVIVTIQDAIKQKAFYDDWVRELKHGAGETDLGVAFGASDHVLEGEMHLGGQEHFYLETHASIAVPKGEDGELEIFCSTQHPSEIQLLVAHTLGVPMNRIVCRTRRMGGGFGGKETRSAVLALPVALAAQRAGKPVRCMLDRDEDMTVSGTRHPFYCKWKAGFMKTGRLHALRLEIFNNAGNSLDLSASVLERSLFSADNAYNIPHVHYTGKCCRTNLPSNTAFRGFGGPQGMMFCENVMDQVADFLRLEPSAVRELNMYSGLPNAGSIALESTHYNQPLEYCTVRRCWDEVRTSAGYVAKVAQCAQFNREHAYRKRGVAVIPTKFGIAFTALFLNQAGSLVLVYRDGSVLLNHGGTEMGQGLHTKMIQVASRALHVSASKIHVVETATDKVPNTSATAASAGSDLNGGAVLDACQQIYDRLAPYREANPKGKWEDWVTSAYFDRVSLSASGFYRTPGIGFDWKTQSGNAFNYFCFGAAVSVVEIDTLTGDHEVKSTDIVMDVGESLNPAIDIGQVEGGFMQGYGLYTLEELHYTPTGFLLTKGPGAYKLPGFGDVPAEFNVSLLRGAPNVKAVFSSKAVGEPPLFLASSVFFAIKDAIKAARRDAGLPPKPFRLDSPATAERIRMACEDRFTKNFPAPKEGSYKPWAVRP